MDILSAITEVEEGDALAAANHAFHNVLEAVRLNGLPGEVLIKIGIQPDYVDRGVVKTVRLTVGTDEKNKKPTRRPTTFYVDGNGNLTRNDPRQTEMFQEQKQ